MYFCIQNLQVFGCWVCGCWVQNTSRIQDKKNEPLFLYDCFFQATLLAQIAELGHLTAVSIYDAVTVQQDMAEARAAFKAAQLEAQPYGSRPGSARSRPGSARPGSAIRKASAHTRDKEELQQHKHKAAGALKGGRVDAQHADAEGDVEETLSTLVALDASSQGMLMPAAARMANPLLPTSACALSALPIEAYSIHVRMDAARRRASATKRSSVAVKDEGEGSAPGSGKDGVTTIPASSMNDGETFPLTCIAPNGCMKHRFPLETKIVIHNPHSVSRRSLTGLIIGSQDAAAVVRPDNSNSSNVELTRWNHTVAVQYNEYQPGDVIVVIDAFGKHVTAAVDTQEGSRTSSTYVVKPETGHVNKFTMDLNMLNHYIPTITQSEYGTQVLRYQTAVAEESTELRDSITGILLKTDGQLVGMQLLTNAKPKAGRASNVPSQFEEIGDVADMVSLIADTAGTVLHRGQQVAKTFLLLASVGTGKTWLSTQLLNIVSTAHRGAPGRKVSQATPPPPSAFIPILISLQVVAYYMGPHSKVVPLAEYDGDYIEWYIDAKFGTDAGNRQMLLDAYRSRRLLLLFDGFDEAPAVKDDLALFICTTLHIGGHRVVVTSRPGSDVADTMLKRHGYVEFALKPLTEQQRRLALQQQLPAEAALFMTNLIDFHSFQSALDEAYSSKTTADEKQMLADVPPVSGQSMDEAPLTGSSKLQHTRDGKRTVHSAKELLEAAHVAAPIATAALTEIAIELALCVTTFTKHVPNMCGLLIASLKDEAAIDEEAFENAGNGSNLTECHAQICDVYRATFVCKDAAQLCKVIRLLDGTANIKVLQRKNYFYALDPVHLRRVEFRVRVSLGGGVYHYVDVQAHLSFIFEFKMANDLALNTPYAYFRSLFIRGAKNLAKLRDVQNDGSCNTTTTSAAPTTDNSQDASINTNTGGGDTDGGDTDGNTSATDYSHVSKPNSAKEARGAAAWGALKTVTAAASVITSTVDEYTIGISWEINMLKSLNAWADFLETPVVMAMLVKVLNHLDFTLVSVNDLPMHKQELFAIATKAMCSDCASTIAELDHPAVKQWVEWWRQEGRQEGRPDDAQEASQHTEDTIAQHLQSAFKTVANPSVPERVYKHNIVHLLQSAFKKVAFENQFFPGGIDPETGKQRWVVRRRFSLQDLQDAVEENNGTASAVAGANIMAYLAVHGDPADAYRLSTQKVLENGMDDDPDQLMMQTVHLRLQELMCAQHFADDPAAFARIIDTYEDAIGFAQDPRHAMLRAFCTPAAWFNFGLAWLGPAFESETPLDLRDLDLELAGGLMLANVLSVNRTITHINIRGNGIGPEGARAVAEALATNKAVVSLHMQHNELGPEGGEAMAAALTTNRAISVLSLAGNQLDAKAAKALANALATNLAVTELDLGDNMIGLEGAKALAKILESSKTVTGIRLGGNALGVEAAAVFGKLLTVNTSLTSLDLQNNSLGPDGGRLLAEAIKANVHITRLNLAANDIGPGGGTALAAALATNEALTDLDLTYNHLDDEVAYALADALLSNGSLVALQLANNVFGFESESEIRKAWGNRSNGLRCC